MEENNGVAPTLRGMKLYQTVEFEMERYNVVASAIQRQQTVTLHRFTQKKNSISGKLEVTRIK